MAQKNVNYKKINPNTNFFILFPRLFFTNTYLKVLKNTVMTVV